MTLAPREIVQAPAREWKSYPEYKDSRVEWLGEIPGHWDILFMKRVARRLQAGSTPPTAEDRYYEDGTVPWFGPGSFSSNLVLGEPVKLISATAIQDGAARIFERGSTMIVTIGATVGKVGYIESSASSNQQITGVTFEAGRVVPKFAAYQVKRLEPVLRGIAPNTTLPILDQQEVGNLPFCVPSISEQYAISAFLDRETEKIDDLIAKREHLMELLEEKRVALISRAVTKGLDPAVPMKDSGVEWLGEIPEHWKVRRLKHVARLESGHTPSRSVPEYWENCTIPWVSLNDIGQLKDRDYITDTVNYINELGLANSSARLLPPDTVILSRDATVGRCGILGREMATAQHFVNWICGEDLLPEYLLLVFRVPMQQEFESLTMGATIRTIGMPDINLLRIPLPPLSQQQEIARFVQDKRAKIDVLIGRLQEHIEKLREYRTALISAAVTGKIDVREESTVHSKLGEDG